MTTYYKAVRPDGTSFWDPEFRWVPESGPVEGIVVEHPNPDLGGDASGYLSVSTAPADCIGMQWPCRLLEVEPVDGAPVHTSDRADLPNKRTASAWRVVRELPAHLALGPQGEHVSALLARVWGLAVDELRRLAARYVAGVAARDAAWYVARRAAWDAAEDAWDATWDAARGAARGAARRAAGGAAQRAAGDAAEDAWDAARRAARGVAGDAAEALTVRDLISTEHYDTLTRVWREVVGPIHPDDPDLRGAA